MTDNEWLAEMGLCHKCRKNRAAPDRKYCFDCLDKIREENARRYDSGKRKHTSQDVGRFIMKKRRAGYVYGVIKK